MGVGWGANPGIDGIIWGEGGHWREGGTSFQNYREPGPCLPVLLLRLWSQDTFGHRRNNYIAIVNLRQ